MNRTIGSLIGHLPQEGSFPSKLVLAFTWPLVILYMANALWFVLRASNPVIQADAWHFLDVFVRKAIDGDLHFADFFAKRSVDDHAQPLFKLILLFEWRYFDLDFVVEAVTGVVGTIGCGLIFRAVLIRETTGELDSFVPRLAWVAICALLFTLGSVDVWVWPLVAMENITILVILVFMLAVWHAHRNQSYLLLAAITLVLGISSDDSALVAVTATLMTILAMSWADPKQRRAKTAMIFLIVVACESLVRFGYAHVSGAQVMRGHALAPVFDVLIERFNQGGWWQWVLLPLVLPVYYQSPLGPAHAHVWLALQVIMGALLLLAHVLFWRRALRGAYNLPIFMAVSMMLLAYGWLAGIIFWRVSAFDNDYLQQPRYVLLYAEHLIALLLMWAGAHESRFTVVTTRCQQATWWRIIRIWAPVAGALLLLMVQVPQSLQAWRMPKYLGAYYAKQAAEIDALARDPVHTKSCELVNPICGAPPEVRRELTQLLSANRLNVYSPKVQRRHPYLPALAAESVSSAGKTESSANKPSD